MRVIAGSHGGRQLITPRNRQIRPTTDRVKQVIFDTLDIPFNYPVVLDLFAGTGNLGFEALSRGATAVTFVEKSKKAVQLIKQNAKRLSFQDKCSILPVDVLKALTHLVDLKQTFSLIFADPPYRKMLSSRLIQAIDRGELLMPGGAAIIEHSAKDTPNIELDHLQIIKTKSLGETSFSYFIHR
jgi:16S rRNA (guanine966-N2)-methyltransferase